MKIDASDSDQFGKLFEALAQDIIHAKIHYRLHCDLRDAVDEFEVELNQSRTFWSLTIAAHVDSTHSRLFRAYDQHPRALSLCTLLKEVLRHPESFEASPPAKDVEQDLLLVRTTDPLVKTLMKYRGSVFAHRNMKNVIQELRLEDRFGLTYDDLDELLSRAVTILNKYDHSFRRTRWSAEIVGHDDFRQVLESVRETNERRKEPMDELRRYEQG